MGQLPPQQTPYAPPPPMGPPPGFMPYDYGVQPCVGGYPAAPQHVFYYPAIMQQL
jgi:hypothetical protein